jgi:FKBP-type peptidyl-prolyl cis-trans isomerase
VPADPTHPDKPPFGFRLVPDHASVIEGWNKGILGMKQGGERILHIPWSMAYGEAGKPPQIPAKSDLDFDVKLLGLVKTGHEGDYGIAVLKKGSGPAVKEGDWVTITYTAKLLNDMQIDDSTTLPTRSLQFQAGTGALDATNSVTIKGVVAGVVGMQAGGEYLLTLPPLLAMNPEARNANLTDTSIVKFDIKVLRVLPKKGPDLEGPK